MVKIAWPGFDEDVYVRPSILERDNSLCMFEAFDTLSPLLWLARLLSDRNTKDGNKSNELFQLENIDSKSVFRVKNQQSNFKLVLTNGTRPCFIIFVCIIGFNMHRG